MAQRDPVIDWLLQSDPSVKWQAMRDLLDLPEASWQAERAKVETAGWGARLLACQDADGQWAGGAFVPAGYTEERWKKEGQPWTATCFCMQHLRLFGLDPQTERARRTVELIGKNCRWDHDGQPYWDGEVEECINGRTVADGTYFGVDVSPIVERLLDEMQPDGGWNCERANGSVKSSFHTTINVLEGLLEYQTAGGKVDVREARRGGEEYLLKRSLFRRLSTGEPADPDFLLLLNPVVWRYDILRALDYFRAASLADGTKPDQRLGEAIEILRSKQGNDGTWPLEKELRGPVWFKIEDGVGKPSPTLTLRALRVLKWWDAHAA